MNTEGLTFSNILWGLQVWATVQPGPSPRIGSLSLSRAIGTIVGGVAKIGADRIWKNAEPLSDEAIKSAEGWIKSVLNTCAYLQNKQRSTEKSSKKTHHKKKKTSTRWFAGVYKSLSSYTASIIQSGATFPPIAAVEKFVRLEALKVRMFLIQKPISIEGLRGYKTLRSKLENAAIFKALETEREEIKKNQITGVNIDVCKDAFFEDIGSALLDKLPADAKTPTSNETIGYGVKALTQFGISWYLRYSMYNYVIGFVPEFAQTNFTFHLITLGIGGIIYSELARSYANGELASLRKQSLNSKTNCLALLDEPTISEIRSLASKQLLCTDNLRKQDDKLSEIEKILKEISKFEEKSEKKNDDGFGYISSDSEEESDEELEEEKEKPADAKAPKSENNNNNDNPHKLIPVEKKRTIQKLNLVETQSTSKSDSPVASHTQPYEFQFFYLPTYDEFQNCDDQVRKGYLRIYQEKVLSVLDHLKNQAKLKKTDADHTSIIKEIKEHLKVLLEYKNEAVKAEDFNLANDFKDLISGIEKSFTVSQGTQSNNNNNNSTQGNTLDTSSIDGNITNAYIN